MIGVVVGFQKGYAIGWKRLTARANRKFQEELIAQAHEILEEAKILVPYKTGFLHDSGEVGEPVGDKLTFQVPITFTAPYAIYVHENMDNYHAPPTQAKYLEDAVHRVLNRKSRRTLRWFS